MTTIRTIELPGDKYLAVEADAVPHVKSSVDGKYLHRLDAAIPIGYAQGHAANRFGPRLCAWVNGELIPAYRADEHAKTPIIPGDFILMENAEGRMV